MESLIISNAVQTIPITCIDEQYGRYRLIRPKAEKVMILAMERYGQLTPVIVGKPMDGRYPMVDGFKRLRACQQLGFKELKAQVLATGKRTLKAAIIHLNRKNGSLTDMEEAMIVQAFYREDKLSQVEIATLLGFHKSWVNRRLAIVERLEPQIIEQVRLGLIGTGLTRELVKLPRGNQSDVLQSIRKHKMTCREAAQLVVLIKERPRWDHEAILRFPESILTERHPERPKNYSSHVCKTLSDINKRCLVLLNWLQKKETSSLPKVERERALQLLENIEGAFKVLKMLPQLLENENADF